MGRFDIDYFPLIILANNGKYVKYQGKPSINQLTSFLQLALQGKGAWNPIPGEIHLIPFLKLQIQKKSRLYAK